MMLLHSPKLIPTKQFGLLVVTLCGFSFIYIMKALRNAWITFAVDEPTALQALVLTQSLRRVVTSSDIVILVSQDLSSRLRMTLEDICDLVMVYEQILKRPTTLSKLAEAKLFTWNMIMYDKCAVLDPSILVLKNVDELFDLGETSAFENNIGQFDNSFFVMEPSCETYRKLCDFARSSKMISKLNDNFISAYVTATGRTVTSIMLSIYERKFATFFFEGIKLWNPVAFDNGSQPWLKVYSSKDLRFSHNYSEAWWAIFTSDVLRNIEFNEQNPLDTKQWRLSTAEGKINSSLVENVTVKSYHNNMKNSIAVVGHSVRLPGANSVNEFWELMKNGGDGITSFPTDRLEYYDISDNQHKPIKAGFLNCSIDEFDAKFFGISPREAAFMDPQQRLLLEVTWEALENAGINPEKLKGSNTGVYSGIWKKDYENMLKENANGKNFHHAVLGNTFGATSGRISHFFGLNGPNVSTESGCSSSMVALHLACTSLQKRETNMALVAGVNLLISLYFQEDISILANDGRCKTFDEKADGFGRAEGVVVVVLKRMADAVKDGDRILGIIRGSAVSSEGTTTSFGTPSKYCQEIAIRGALGSAGVKPEDIDYVEAHGTGTSMGDPVEFSAISAGYAAKRKKPLIVSSVKTNIGHTESAAGLASLVKVMLSMEKELIPAHKNFTTLNNNIDLGILPAIIPVTECDWRKNDSRKRLAGLSSFGISGTNVHVIMEEPPIVSNNRCENFIKHHILAISAKNENALNELVNNYSKFFDNNLTSFEDICLTALLGRQHFKNRIAVVAKDFEDAKNQLMKQHTYSPLINNDQMKTIFLFTGQGSQYPGMAKTLYQTSSVFRKAFEMCSCLFSKSFGIDLERIITCETEYVFNSFESQMSIFCVEYCLLELWKSFGVKPDYILGHSVGEFVAVVAAEIMSLKDAANLLSERCRLVNNLPLGGMLVLITDIKTVEMLISRFCTNNKGLWLDIAVINSDDEVVVSGRKNTLNEFAIFCSDQNVKTQFLAANHAFHSREMDDMLEEFQLVADRFQYSASKYEYISGTTGRILNHGEMGGEYWKNHARCTVDFTKGVKLAQERGCKIFIEIGPHPVLLALGMSNLSLETSQQCIWLPSIRRNENNWLTFLNSIVRLFQNGYSIDWKGYALNYVGSKTELPHYPFQRQKYWIKTEEDELTSKPLHPLLGRKVALATTKEFIFQNKLVLNDFPYLRDHQVGNIIILPAAVFLEIIIATGNHIFNHGKHLNNLFVDSFVVDAPLELQENKTHIIQIVASEIENNETATVRVFMYTNINGFNDEKSWKLFSSGRLSIKKQNGCNCNKKELRPNFNFELSQNFAYFYKTTSDIGIHFGDQFQSIAEVWSNDTDIISKINIPLGAGVMNEYILHPIIMDAMLQTYGFSTMEKSAELQLPVGITSFSTSLNRNKEYSHFFAQMIRYENAVDNCVHLFDQDYIPVATMCGIKLAKTSISSFLNVIEGNKNKLPGMYQQVWRQRDGILNNRVNFSILPDTQLAFRKMLQDIEPILTDYDEIKFFFSKTHNLCFDIVQYVFRQAGWDPKLNDTFTTQSFVTDFLFAPVHSMLINRCLSILKEEGILQVIIVNEEPNWLVMKQLGRLEDLKNVIDTTYYQLSKFKEAACMKHSFGNLLEVLQGKKAGLDVLFSDPDLNPLILYTDSKLSQLEFLRLSGFINHKLEGLTRYDSILRIIEVGAGSGATTKEVVESLRKKGIPFSYTFTDITPVFLEQAKSYFGSASEMEYKLLNIETDPKYQGFIPNSYDIVIAANVIHATEYLQESLQNIRQLLVPSGMFILQEMLRPIRLMDIVFGMLDSYWRFKDFDIRSNHPCVDFQTWENLLMSNGFKSAMNISNDDEFSQVIVATASTSHFEYQNCRGIQTLDKIKDPLWIILAGNNEVVAAQVKRYLQDSGEISYIIYDLNCNPSSKFFQKIDFSDSQEIESLLAKLHSDHNIKGIICLFCLDPGDMQESFCRTTMYITQYICNSRNIHPKLLVATKGVNFIGDQKNGDPFKATVWGFFKTLKNEYPDLNCQVLDLDPEEGNDLILGHQIFTEIWKPFSKGFVAIRNNKRYLPKLVSIEAPTPLTLPNGRYEIVLPQSKKIDDLSFRSTITKQLKSDEVELLVKASALNFKDILTITKPDQYYTDFNAVGMDFSGVVTKIGENVDKFKIGDECFGISSVSALASHVTVPYKILAFKPQEFTFAEAATVPSVFLTAYHCLVDVGKLKALETVLIHVASGGVGLIAIQIAKYIGAKIIATAGNKRKREYLKSIGIDNVFHSRNLTFGEEILKVTNGSGVDMVLNSLTGSGFKETTLNACARNARFVEMGKMNIWQPKEVSQLRPDVKYTIINLERVDNTDLERLTNYMNSFVQQGKLRPLPYTNFPLTQVKEAFKYFLKAQHIGKIVVTMPELKVNFGTYFRNDLLFSRNATYLITGGLGGIGLEILKWMVKCGAHYVVLASRSAPDANTQQLMNSMRLMGFVVLTQQVDIGNRTECEKLFHFINKNLPPLKGVMHSAGILSDAAVRNQTWEKFETVFNAKVNGTLHLHELTKNLDLEHFVLFSSIATIVGTMGQSNHSSANAFMDSLASYRHALGLPAQTINWGAWSEIGAATDTVYGKEGVFGLKPFTPTQGIAALKFALTSPYVQVTAINFDPATFATCYPFYTNYLSELLSGDNVASDTSIVQSEGFWVDLEKLPPNEKVNYIKMCVERIFRDTLKLPDGEKVDEYQIFSEMGLDSLMAVEMRSKLQHLLGNRCPLKQTLLLDYPTINVLSKFIADVTLNTDQKISGPVDGKKYDNDLILD